MEGHPCRTLTFKAAGRGEQPQLSDPHVEPENRVNMGWGRNGGEIPGPEDTAECLQ